MVKPPPSPLSGPGTRSGGVDASSDSWVAAVRTHVGRVRDHNEDAFVCRVEDGLFAVIDGMGGLNAGEVAAGLLKRALERAPLELPLPEVIHGANQEIRERAERSPSEAGMGCVVTAVRAEGTRLDLGHVGDTRAYLATSAGCEQLTRDHTAVADAQEALGLSGEQAESLPGRHRVTRDVGRSSQPDARWVESASSTWNAGDLLLLCSDGAYDGLAPGELERMVSQARRDGVDPAAFAERLVALALSRGGRDNITVLVVRRLVGTADRGPRPSRWPWIAGALLGLGVGLGVGLGLGGGGSPRDPRSPSSARMEVRDLEVAKPGALLLPGEAHLDGTLAFSGTVTGLGRVEVADSAPRTTLAGGSDIELRALDVAFAARAPTWTVVLEEGARLLLQQVRIDAPRLALEVDLRAPHSELELVGVDLELASLRIRGRPHLEVPVVGGALRIPKEAIALEGGVELALPGAEPSADTGESPAPPGDGPPPTGEAP